MRSLILALPILTLLAISSANAQPGPTWMAEELNLTDQQIQSMDDLRYQHQKAMIRKNAELKEAKLDFRRLMDKVDVDEKAALQQHKRISALKAEISEAKISHKLAMRKVLNKEQLEKFLKLQRKRGDRSGFHRGGWGNRHGMHSGECMGSGGGPMPGKQPRQ